MWEGDEAKAEEIRIPDEGKCPLQQIHLGTLTIHGLLMLVLYFVFILSLIQLLIEFSLFFQCQVLAVDLLSTGYLLKKR